MPLISVVLPVHNGMPSVKEAVDSIYRQTFTNWELIIVNDGSSDDSGAYLSEISACSNKITFISHSDNQGVGAAYNTGIHFAKGRYIAFQEQDDISLPERFASQLSAIENYQIPMVTSCVGWFDENGKVYKYWPEDIRADEEVTLSGYDMYRQILIHQTCFANTTTMIDRSRFWLTEPWFDEHFRRSGQDWDFHLRLVLNHETIRLRKPLVLMRRYPSHYSSTGNKTSVFSSSRTVLRKHWAFHRNFYNGRRDYQAFSKALSNQLLIEARHFRYLRGAILGLGSLLLWPNNPAAHLSLRNFIRI